MQLRRRSGTSPRRRSSRTRSTRWRAPASLHLLHKLNAITLPNRAKLIARRVLIRFSRRKAWSTPITAAYVNSLGGPFQFDDYSVIVNNSSVHSFSAWLADGGIRPVLKLSYMLNWVSGLGAVGFHLVNVGIHAANTFLVYRLCCLLASGRESAECRGGSNFLAVAVALAFALHPVQTEAVTYVSGRSTSLMAMFYLGSLVTYQKGRKTGSAVYVHLVSPMLFALALMTKEIAVTLPFALGRT